MHSRFPAATDQPRCESCWDCVWRFEVSLLCEGCLNNLATITRRLVVVIGREANPLSSGT